MAEVVREVLLQGFDPGAEPYIRVMSDGSVEVWFEFMPPSDVPDEERVELGRFASFDQEMERAIGVPVVWEDREFFRIDKPALDTVDRLRAFIEGYRRGA
jgi:hypothetical protein